MFAFHQNADSTIDYIGKVVRETETKIRLQIVDAVMATGCGMWDLTDELRDVPKAECRLFTDKLTCLETALQINNRILSSVPHSSEPRP